MQFGITKRYIHPKQFISKIDVQRYCDFRASIIKPLIVQAVSAAEPDIALTAMAQLYPTPENQSFLRQQYLAIATFYIKQNQVAKAIPLLDYLLK